MTLYKDTAWRRSCTLQINRDDRVDRLPFAAMVLTHADPAIARPVDHTVGKAPASRRRGWCRRQRLWRAVDLAIKPSVGEVREDDRAVRDQPCAAAVLVHARTDVERRGREVARRSTRGPRAHDHVAPLFLRP